MLIYEKFSRIYHTKVIFVFGDDKETEVKWNNKIYCKIEWAHAEDFKQLYIFSF